MHTVSKLSYDCLSCTLSVLILCINIQHLNMLCFYLIISKNDEMIHCFELFIGNSGYANNFNLNMYAH